MKKKILALVVCAAMVIGCSSVMVSAEDGSDFDWQAYAGTELNVFFSEHTYSDAVEAKLDDFEELTGINVNYSTMPETNYFEKLTVDLSSGSGTPDIFMTGAYQMWEYATAGYIEPLDDYINDPSLTNPDYNYDDFIPAVIDALKWDLVPGHSVGTGSQWTLPMGWEINLLTYNERIFEEEGLTVPETTEELYDLATSLEGFNGSGSYGLAVRGLAEWGTIHPGYMSLYATYGAKDFEIEDGHLVSQVNSPEAIAMTEYWVDLVKNGGAPQWSTYSWEMCDADIGAGIAAIMWDADRCGYSTNVEGASAESGNLAFALGPYPEDYGKTADDRVSNLWVWSMGMNSASKNKEAAWYFLQYFSGPEFQQFSGTDGACADTPRQSVADSDEYIACLADATGYTDAFNEAKEVASIYFTPQPYFTETTTEWAKTLQALVVSDTYASVEDAMNELADTMNAIVYDLEVEE